MDLLFDRNRIGIFKVSVDAIETGELPELFYKLGVTVVRVEMIYSLMSVEYTAYSPHFEHVAVDEIPPYYQIIVHVDDDGNRTYEFKKG